MYVVRCGRDYGREDGREGGRGERREDGREDGSGAPSTSSTKKLTCLVFAVLSSECKGM